MRLMAMACPETGPLKEPRVWKETADDTEREGSGGKHRANREAFASRLSLLFCSEFLTGFPGPNLQLDLVKISTQKWSQHAHSR